MADVKIKDAPLVATVKDAIKMPISDGSNLPKTISIEQIKTYVCADLLKRIQELETKMDAITITQ